MNDSRNDKTTTTDTNQMTEDKRTVNFKDTLRKNRQNAVEEESRGAEDEGRLNDADDDIAQIKDALNAARQETADAHDRLLRATADFENFKKRTQRQVEDQRKFANESLLRELLSVVDNLERAISASNENPSQDVSCMIQGVQMTLNEILKIFQRYNVTPLEAQGKPFDPAYHEAVMQAETDEHPENTVINEFQKGYLLHDRLLRPAMVVVSKGSSPTNSNTPDK